MEWDDHEEEEEEDDDGGDGGEDEDKDGLNPCFLDLIEMSAKFCLGWSKFNNKSMTKYFGS